MERHRAWYFLALPVSLITPKKSRANIWSMPATLQQLNTTRARHLHPHLNPGTKTNTQSALKLLIRWTEAGQSERSCQLNCWLLPETRRVVPDNAAKVNNSMLYRMMQTEENVWASSANSEAVWKKCLRLFSQIVKKKHLGQSDSANRTAQSKCLRLQRYGSLSPWIYGCFVLRMTTRL